ncbi:hypothetical protein HDF16_003393 [Granulicella aggregans]|uniref:Glycosyltransferase RgtA/B/C/D-like domain-containing protein n=1 Tax=Granulicella aggregans TaxID=474949 RepID=A0A7W7ZFK4_9BACT|nr:hypothetical protein [Granulicella aggregans]MBB5058679.1 hypothetical protein [Granulicella aggregans]
MTDPFRLAEPVDAEPYRAQATETQSTLRRLASPFAYGVIVVLVALLFAAILKINRGTFTYTLDDPYIHLALSDQIRHGNYGLYPGTHAAPSSSILFPFLLAIASGTRLHPYFPLLINIACLLATVEITRRFLHHLRLGSDNLATFAQAAAVALIAISFNLVGVVFTGLEHSLHIALVAATVYGAVQLIDRRQMPRWLPLVLILAPLVRYEGIALSIGTILLLALRGRRRTALATFAAMTVLIVGFSIFLKHLGLSALPSSIMVKSVVAGGMGGGAQQFLHGLTKTLDTMIGHPIGLPLLLIGLFAAARFSQDLFRRGHPWTPNGLISLPLLCLIGGQAVAGRFGWLERYEDYLLLGVCLMSLFLARTLVRFAMSPERRYDVVHRSRAVLIAGAFAALLLVGARYVNSTAHVPQASNNVYEQQLQMHRFIDGYYRAPVAVNDLGLVSYHNPYPVLDLGGLGSETARLMIAHHASPADYQAFVAANGVHLVIVYQEWFPDQIPNGWTHVATLALTGPLVSAAEAEVQFYATDSGTASRVHQNLVAFQPSLPPGANLTLD